MRIWQPIDIRTDPDEPRTYDGDPADIVDALGEMLAVSTRPGWHAVAACRGKGPDAWYPQRGEGLEEPRRMCESCPVREECREAGMNERHGLWGGLSERQRRVVRRAGRQEAA